MRTLAVCNRFLRRAVSLMIVLTVTPVSADLVSHWSFDATLEDSGPAGNDGEFQGGGGDPVWTEGFDGEDEGALLLDGTGFVLVANNDGLPLTDNPSYSVAMWVNGGPQPDYRVFSESSDTDNSPLFNIGTDNTGATGELDIFIRRNGGQGTAVGHFHSQDIAFVDGEWHHIAVVDDNETITVYIDGVPDPNQITYTREPMDTNLTTIGGILRGGGPSHMFIGAIDDVHVYDHALTPEEIGALLGAEECPAEGDTHCSNLVVDGPDGEPGIYVATATGSDDTGDDVRYVFRADNGAGTELTPVEQTGNEAQFDLPQGTWTISVTADDDPLCGDLADDATCTSDPIVIACPAVGDTHCDDIQITGPVDGGPGLYSVSILGASDDSDDEILYLFTATEAGGANLSIGPIPDSFADFNLTQGEWTISVTVDDDPNCDDVAGDATCTDMIEVACPEEGDTHCDDFVVERTEDDLPGTLLVSALGATDDGDDFITYIFRAESAAGKVVEFAQDTDTAFLTLGPGTWQISVTVDDDPLCDDVADDATCSEEVTIVEPEQGMISHWKFDGDVTDELGNNDGIFEGDVEPNFVDGFDGTAEGAILFDGIDDMVVVPHERNLPLYANDAYTVAMWVKGGPQPDYRVWSEASTLERTTIFNIGTQSAGQTGQVDLFIRQRNGQTPHGHTWSARDAFDDEWHHIAWVDDDGEAVLYIDGVRDGQNYAYTRPHLGMNTTTIGGILRDTPSHWFIGAIDDVRIFNYALSQEEIEAIVPEPDDCPGDADTHCDDLQVSGPAGNFEGPYTVSVLGATDDTGDDILYTFAAVREDGTTVSAGPDLANSAVLNLGAGTWTISATVDDDILCRDVADDATCSQEVTVIQEPQILLSHWTFDSTLEDQEPAGNDGVFVGEPEAPFVEDRDGNEGAALTFDGVDDFVNVAQNEGLPLYPRARWSVAMWVRGGPQNDKRVWSEGSTTNNNPLFNIGTERSGQTGQVDLFVRNAGGGVILGHVLSEGIAFDNTWHHIAWTDNNGDAVLYIDGEPDPTDFSYTRPDMDFDTTTIGGILRGGPCCLFNGQIDDVQIYNYDLSAAEVRAIVEGMPPEQQFKRGDANNDGGVNIADMIYMLNRLFGDGAAPTCLEAAELNGDNAFNIADAIFGLNRLFGDGPPPIDGAGAEGIDCGADPNPDQSLGCLEYTQC